MATAHRALGSPFFCYMLALGSAFIYTVTCSQFAPDLSSASGGLIAWLTIYCIAMLAYWRGLHIHADLGIFDVCLCAFIALAFGICIGYGIMLGLRIKWDNWQYIDLVISLTLIGPIWFDFGVMGLHVRKTLVLRFVLRREGAERGVWRNARERVRLESRGRSRGRQEAV